MRAALAFAGLLVAATASPEELFPLDRDYSMMEQYPDMHAYHLAARDALLGRSNRHTCEAIVIPSFEREWAVYLQETPSGREVVSTIMQSQLWGEMHRAAERPDHSIQAGDTKAALSSLPKDVWRFSAPLTASTASLVEQSCAALLARAEVPPEPRRCIDGVGYQLFQSRPGLGARGGWAHCPSRESPAFRMLEILEDLRKTAGSSGADLMQRDMALARKATQLLLALESTSGRPAR